MPVYGTPQDAGQPPGGAVCSDQSTLAPEPGAVFGCRVIARQRAAAVTQGLAPTIEWTMLDRRGRPVDLTSCGTYADGDSSTGRVVLKVRESVIAPAAGGDPVTTVTGRGVVAASGKVLFDVPASATARAGIFLAEARAFAASGAAVFSNQFYFVVERSLHAADPCGHPPTIAELRLHLHDSGPEDNPLLEDVQFDLAELAAAIERPVLYWNESLPPIDALFTTTSFPFRYNWLNGTVAQLYLMAAHFYRRNRLAVQAGGVQVDDLGKAQEYEQAGRQTWEEYKDWVLKKKVQLNAEACIQSQFSPYVFRNYF